MIGVVLTFARASTFIGRFFSGYIGDRVNRKTLAILTYVFAGIGYIGFGLSDNMIIITLAIIFLSATTLFAAGSSAYMFDNLPRELGGIGMGLYMAGRAFSLIGLTLFGAFLSFGLPFVYAAQIMFLLTGISYFINAIIRIVFLDPGRKIESQGASIITDFIHQYHITLKVLFLIFPIFIFVLLVDALSDGIYNYVYLFYINESLGFSIGSINLMMMFTLLISVPLNLKTGSFLDKHGSNKTIMIIYSFMPITMFILYISQYVEYIAPQIIVNMLDGIMPGLSVIVSTAFIGVSTKAINDALWATALNAYVKKTIPSKSISSMMGVTSVLYYVFLLIAPIPSSILYEMYGGAFLISIVIILNLLILIVLKVKSFQPSKSIEEIDQIFNEH